MYRVTVKQQAKGGRNHLLYFHTVEKYEKIESINTQNDYQKTSKK